MKNNKVLVITQTAIALALLIGVQFVTKPLSTFVTGSLVNLILLFSVLMFGLTSGLVVALVSPFFAFILGIGPIFVHLVPFIAVGNAILVVIAYFIRKNIEGGNIKDIVIAAVGLIGGSVAKTLFLWVGIVLIILPVIPGIKEPQVAALSSTFSWPQLVTSLIGSALALIIVPLVKRAVKPLEEQA